MQRIIIKVDFFFLKDKTDVQNSHVGTTDENLDRGNWSSNTDYLLSLIGCAVGLGNVWRFPYLAYKNGGGAFLIPYTIMLAFAGLPLFFLECSFGQFASLGPVSVWKAVPIMQGVGVTMVLVSSLVAIYYNCIIGYSIYYLFASFQFPLPWSDCFEWSDENCSTQPKEYCNITSANGSFVLVNSTWLNDNNATCEGSNIFSISVQRPSEQYWDKVALRRSSGLDESGGVIWHLALCLLLAWIIVVAALFKGIKSSGKVVYFTAIFPYVVLIILLIRGVTLEGAREGIEYYIGTHSDISKLSDAEVWKDAATQIFFSLGTACGGLVALSSYNKFNNNCYSDAIVVCVTNCATSVFAGFAIFSVLGHIAYISHKPVSEVAQSGFGLAFIAYPEALSKLPISPLWSILFFFMLLTLGIDSQFAIIEKQVTLNWSKRMWMYDWSVCRSVCLSIKNVLSTSLIHHGSAVLELVGIIYIYGGNRFIEDIEMMIGKKNCYSGCGGELAGFFISPCLLMVSTIILVWSLVTFSAPSYGPIPYPIWGTVLGWFMLAFCIIWIPIFAGFNFAKAKGGILERFRQICSPTPDWGPYLECHRGERYKNQESPQTIQQSKQNENDLSIVYANDMLMISSPNCDQMRV
uniref:Transporter n=1 Tax=Erpetoichthys calabaricus TaxID=27687 RepID=A0A8C4XCE0_ERPCA